jgi:hypothetical protein
MQAFGAVQRRCWSLRELRAPAEAPDRPFTSQSTTLPEKMGLHRAQYEIASVSPRHSRAQATSQPIFELHRLKSVETMGRTVLVGT